MEQCLDFHSCTVCCSLCQSSGRTWSYAKSKAASICTAIGCIGQITQTSSRQTTVSTGAAVQILCYTAWSILCHLLINIGAAVLTIGVIVLSTLLAAGFVAMFTMPAAASMCKLCFAAAAYKVTETASVMVPVVKSTAALSLSACLSFWRSIEQPFRSSAVQLGQSCAT